MSWIGGDLAGLQAMGTAMKTAPSSTDGVVKALGSTVDKIVGDAGWSGGAADSFRKAWTATSIQVGALATVTSGVGKILGDLGDNLQKIEADLVNTAHDASQKGAQIGDDGKPGILVITGDPDAQTAKDARQAQADYTNTYNAALKLAQGFRLQAAKDLGDTVSPIKPTGNNSDFSWDKRVTLADYLRGLYAVPNEKNSEWSSKLQDAIKDASSNLDKASQDYLKAHDAYLADGGKGSFDDPTVRAQSAAKNDLALLEEKLKAAGAGPGEAPLSNLLNVKIKDAAKVVPGLDMIKTPEGLDFLKEIPVVDVLASGVVAEFQSQDDIQKGQNPTSARAYDYGAAAIGLAAGAGAVAGAAALGVSAPVWATAVGAGAIVVGVGDVFYEGFHEHWAEDIHDRGVVSGVTHGLGNTFSTSGHDVADLVGSAWDAGKHLWNKVF
ncbi:WXG100 family type VII secretion target [Nocardia tengchongensis]